MPQTRLLNPKTLPQDLLAGLTTCLVSLPVCAGIALAAGLPVGSGIVSGIIGGLIVGYFSRSHSSVSGPAAGLTTITAAQLVYLEGLPGFAVSLILAGFLQIAFGFFRAGIFTGFFPSSLLHGVLYATGILLILKQLPHLLGHHTNPVGEMSFWQPNEQTTFSGLLEVFQSVDPVSAGIGLFCLMILIVGSRLMSQQVRYCLPLSVILLASFAHFSMDYFALNFNQQEIQTLQLTSLLTGMWENGIFVLDWSVLTRPVIFQAAFVLAVMASLESLLHLSAIDDFEPRQRTSPPSRELMAQGLGNVLAGFLGGVPICVSVDRSVVSLAANSQTKMATLLQGGGMLLIAGLFPLLINSIPLAAIAAVLIFMGGQLANLKFAIRSFRKGKDHFIPWLATIMGILLTDIFTGIIIGLAISLSFILYSNFRQPIRRVIEKHLGGDLLHIELPNQVSFFKKAALQRTLEEIPHGGHVLIDAIHAVYIDPDVLELIRHYREHKAPLRDIEVSLVGFREQYRLQDRIQYVDYSTRELQQNVSPLQVLEILQAGHQRFAEGNNLIRDFSRQFADAPTEHHPLAAVLGCLDSGTPAEVIFDLGAGDIYSVNVAGAIAKNKIMGSLEYACKIAGAKLIVVLGHTNCGAVQTALECLHHQADQVENLTGCQHLNFILEEIQEVLTDPVYQDYLTADKSTQERLLKRAVHANVLQTVHKIREQSETIKQLLERNELLVVGAIYDRDDHSLEFIAETDENRYAGSSGLLVSVP